jgi:hypothetical protein
MAEGFQRVRYFHGDRGRKMLLEVGGVLQGIGLAARRTLGKRGALWWKADRGLSKRIGG